MISESSKGELRIFRLDDNGEEITIRINPGKKDVAFFVSKDFDFLKMVGEEPTRDEAQRILEEELDLRTSGETQVAGVFHDEFSIVFMENSELYAGEKWTEEEKKLYPED